MGSKCCLITFQEFCESLSTILWWQNNKALINKLFISYGNYLDIVSVGENKSIIIAHSSKEVCNLKF